jgi:Transglycosylase SLT domain
MAGGRLSRLARLQRSAQRIRDGDAVGAAYELAKTALLVKVGLPVMAVLAVLLVIVVVIVGALAKVGHAAGQACGSGGQPTPVALTGSGTGPVGPPAPASYVPIYQTAAARFALGDQGPSILAAINQVETNFDQSTLPGVHSGANSAGAEGAMQFEPSTWARYGMVAPGGANPASPYDEADAVWAAANYLHASGAPGDWRTAIFAYNHAGWYVDEVLRDAAVIYQSGQAAGAQGLTPGGQVPAPAGTAAVAEQVAATNTPDPTTGPLSLVPGQTVTVAATDFTDAQGYKGDNLNDGTMSYAELGGHSETTSTLLGGLPYMQPLTISYRGRSVVAYKRDIGYGQGAKQLNGHRYRIDLHTEVARALGFNGEGLVQITLGNAPTPLSGDISCSGTPAPPIGSGSAEFPIQPVSLVVAPSAWTTDQGDDVATVGAACDPQAKEVALGDGQIIRLGIDGFGQWAPVEHITAGPLAGLYVYYGHASPDGPGIKVDSHVVAGQVISYVGCGDVGISTGPHVEAGFTFPDGAPGPLCNGSAYAMYSILRSLYAGHGIPDNVAVPSPSVQTKPSGKPCARGPGQ